MNISWLVELVFALQTAGVTSVLDTHPCQIGRPSRIAF